MFDYLTVKIESFELKTHSTKWKEFLKVELLSFHLVNQKACQFWKKKIHFLQQKRDFIMKYIFENKWVCIYDNQKEI